MYVFHLHANWSLFSPHVSFTRCSFPAWKMKPHKRFGCCRFSIFPANIKPISVYSVQEAPTLLTLLYLAHCNILINSVNMLHYIAFYIPYKFAELSNWFKWNDVHITSTVIFHISFFFLYLCWCFQLVVLAFMLIVFLVLPIYAYSTYSTPQQIPGTYGLIYSAAICIASSYLHSLATDNDGTINCDTVSGVIWTYYSRCCSLTPSEQVEYGSPTEQSRQLCWQTLVPFNMRDQKTTMFKYYGRIGTCSSCGGCPI